MQQYQTSSESHCPLDKILAMFISSAHKKETAVSSKNARNDIPHHTAPHPSHSHCREEGNFPAHHLYRCCTQGCLSGGNTRAPVIDRRLLTAARCFYSRRLHVETRPEGTEHVQHVSVYSESVRLCICPDKHMPVSRTRRPPLILSKITTLEDILSN